MTRVPIRLKKQTKVKTPESGVLRACLDLLAAHNIWWMRINVGAVKIGNRFIRFAESGTADILATFQDDIEPLIHLLWIECKSDSGRQSEAQKAFQRRVQDVGHNYLIVREPEQLITWLKEHGAI